MKGTQYVKS